MCSFTSTTLRSARRCRSGAGAGRHARLYGGDTFGAGFALLPTLRFAHSELYLRDAIGGAGLTLLALDQAAIRTEKGEPVNGLVLVAGLVGEAITVMPAHSRSQNGVAELVVGPAMTI